MFRPTTFLGLGLALAFGAGTASADLYELDVDHSSGSAVGVDPPYGTVTLSLISGGVEIAYSANTSRIIGFHEVAFNYAPSAQSHIDSISVSNNSASNTFPGMGTGVGMGGLGTFSYAFGQPGGNAGNQATQVTVDIYGGSLALSNFESLSTLPPGDTPVYFAAAFARTVDGTVVTGNVGARATAVPEPSTLAIAGLGALGFIGYGLRSRGAADA
jgi:hypothetical protein